MMMMDILIQYVLKTMFRKGKHMEEELTLKLKCRKILKIVLIIFDISLLVSTIIMLQINNCANFVECQKPIIYLYPETEQEVSVKLGNPELLSCSYPKYEDGWKVLAKPNGDLMDLATGRNLYALYWEGKSYNFSNAKDGFMVKSEDSAKFLEEKLEILGLNEREAEEFIVYWLPKLEANPYNFIRFLSDEEIREYMPLNITPEPDTTIRVMMEYKKVVVPYEVEEQELVTPERKGFTVVEWGGSEMK